MKNDRKILNEGFFCNKWQASFPAKNINCWTVIINKGQNLELNLFCTNLLKICLEEVQHTTPTKQVLCNLLISMFRLTK